MCDNCKLRKDKGAKVNFQEEAKLVVDFARTINDNRHRFTIIQAADCLHGRNKKKCKELLGVEKFLDKLKSTPIILIKRLILQLLLAKVLKEDLFQQKQSVSAYLGIGIKEKQFKINEIQIQLTVPKSKAKDKDQCEPNNSCKKCLSNI